MRMRTWILSCRRGTVLMVSKNCSGGDKSSAFPENSWHAFSSSSLGAICDSSSRTQSLSQSL